MPRVSVYVVVALAAALWIAPAHAATSVWCGGAQETAQNRVPDVQFGRGQIHVVYATPADGPDNFAADAPLIVSDIAAIDAWWRGQDPTRTPRFDLYPFPGCAPGFGQLDISFVRLSQPGSAYLDPDLRSSLIANEALTRYGAFVKTIVYYDGPVRPGDDHICGTSRAVAQGGGATGGAFVWLGACMVDLGSGGETAFVAAHELVHDLGAVPLGAPHECPPPNEGHVCGDVNKADILYPFLTAGQTLGSAILDVNRDDYYGHSGSWWDVRNSIWLERLPQFALTISTTGGKGTVFSSPPGLTCPPTCSAQVDNGDTVTLGAAPGPGSRLVQWTGACTGSGPCTLLLDSGKSVTAVFGPATYRLTVAVSGGGKVTGVGAACRATCARALPGGERSTLRATAGKGYRFAGWGGDCSGTGACRLLGDRPHRVAARFLRA